MQALILASGKGTNLRPLTVYTPRPIIPILNVPLLFYQIEILKRAGVGQITLFLDYQPGKIEHVLANESDFGVEVRYVVEPRPLGTAGAYKFASKYSKERTIVLNGDILTDLGISGLIKQHEASRANLTVAMTPIEQYSTYGLIKTDQEQRVTDYLPDPDDSNSNGREFKYMNAGIYIVEPTVADLIPEDQTRTFKHDVFPEMLRRKERLFAFPFPGYYWSAIDSLEKYLSVHRDFLNGKIRHFKNENGTKYERATSAFIDEQSVIDVDCVIKSNARIVNSVLGKGVVVEERAVVEDSVVWSHSRISNSAEISGSLITSSCYIGKNVVVSKGSILADKSSLPDYTRV